MAKFVTAQEAVQYIHSGDRVALAHSVGEPQALVNAMLDNYQAYQQVEICHMLALGPCKYTRPEMAGHFWHNSLFAGPGSRDAVNEGRADYTPNLFGESPRLFYEGFLPIDVALITLSPPDERGWAGRRTLRRALGRAAARRCPGPPVGQFKVVALVTLHIASFLRRNGGTIS